MENLPEQDVSSEILCTVCRHAVAKHTISGCLEILWNGNGTGNRCGCIGIGITDPVNHPTHYTAHPSGVECITITEHMNFCLGNAVKYIWRADLKNGIEDLEKARWYIEREIIRRRRDKPPTTTEYDRT